MKHQVFEVQADPLYQAQLVAAERAFWACVENGTPPVAINIPAPVEAIRRVDMTGNNEFAVHAHLWLTTKAYAKSNEIAAKSMKAMVEADVVEASGHGVVISRSKTGSLTIRETRT